MNEIFVTGHRNPDLDSIVSAIAYASLRSALGDRGYVAAHQDRINEDTDRILDFFGMEPPIRIRDLRTQVSDLDIEVKINKPGTLRFTAFSHSADQYTNYLDNLQRTGVGISWQQEFNHFGHYVRHLFSGKKQRSVLEQLEERQLRSAGTKRITIEE